VRLARGHNVGPARGGSGTGFPPGEHTTRGVGSAKTVEVVAVAEQAVTLVQEGVAQVVVVTPSVCMTVVQVCTQDGTEFPSVQV
jgi:hypothetical protein